MYRILSIAAASLAITLCACTGPHTSHEYTLSDVMEVAGRQGIAADSCFFYVSSSTALYRYDRDGKLVASNENPFSGLELEANHFGDIDVWNGEIYTGIEIFIDGVGRNIQVAVYDAESLTYKYSIPWVPESGQLEVCGLAVDRSHGRVWMADWVQGHELYCYDIGTRQYIGKVALDPAPGLQQGIYCLDDGRILISSDDGDADTDSPDHIYICNPYPDGKDLIGACTDRFSPAGSLRPAVYREMNDFLRAGEIEGISIDPVSENLLVLSNRGSRIVLGMVRGFYEGYDHEIHEVYIYSSEKR